MGSGLSSKSSRIYLTKSIYGVFKLASVSNKLSISTKLVLFELNNSETIVCVDEDSISELSKTSVTVSVT